MNNTYTVQWKESNTIQHTHTTPYLLSALWAMYTQHRAHNYVRFLVVRAED